MTSVGGRRGLTLLEMIVILVILSMLLGLSVSLFRNANRDLGVRAISGALLSVLRSARDHSRMEEVQSWVVLDLETPQSFYPVRRETVGMWHFESLQRGMTPGAFGREAECRGNPVLVQGRIGQALSMNGRTSVDCGLFAPQDPDQGLSLDFWMQWQGGQTPQTICSLGSFGEVRISPTGVLQARLDALKVSMRDARSDITVPADSWFQVRLWYYGRELHLEVNGTEGEKRQGGVTWPKEFQVEVGSQREGLDGTIDELRIGWILPRERTHLPREVLFELDPQVLKPGQKHLWIPFDPEGRLGRPFSGAPLRIGLKSPADQTFLEVGSTGVVERLQIAPLNH